jgi:hypothetical protein
VTIHRVGTFRFSTHDREEWQLPSRPVKGPLATPELVHWVPCHWPGASNTWKPPLDVASHLRWAHDLYLINKGFSYGYAFVIGPNPIDWTADPVLTDIWEVRGFDIRPAANNGDFPPWSDFSNPNFNGRSLPIQVMCSVAFPATKDQQLQFRWMVALADQRYAERVTVQPHRASDATTCPGPGLTPLVPSFAVRPTDPTPVPVPPGPPPVPPAPTTPGGFPRMLICKQGGTPDASWTGWYSYDGGKTMLGVTSMAHAATLVDMGALDAGTRQRVTSRTWVGVTHVATVAEADRLLTPY